MDVRVKLGDSRSNGSQRIQAAHFVVDKRTKPADAGHRIRQNAILAFWLR